MSGENDNNAAEQPTVAANQSQADFVRNVTEELTDAEILDFQIDDDPSATVVVDLNKTLGDDGKAKVNAPAAGQGGIVDPMLAPLDNTDMQYIEKVRREIQQSAQTAADSTAAAGGTATEQKQAADAAGQSSVDAAIANLPEGTDPALVTIIQGLQQQVKESNERTERILNEKRDETRRRQKANFKLVASQGNLAVQPDLMDIAYKQSIEVRNQIQNTTGKTPTISEVLTTMKANFPGLFFPAGAPQPTGDATPAADPAAAAAAAASTEDPKPKEQPTRKVTRKAPPKSPTGANEPGVKGGTAKVTRPRAESLDDCARNMIQNSDQFIIGGN